MISNLMIDCIIRIVEEKRKPVSIRTREITADEATQIWGMMGYLWLVKDTARMQAYETAINGCVKDKTVLEIGTGALAPLARMCVKAGAKKVYAIEANTKAVEICRENLRRDNLTSKIEVVHGLSYDVSLKEKADVLVHEVVGNMGSEEGMVRLVHDAKKRLLKENASFIPLECSVDVVPVEKPTFINPPFFIIANLYRFILWRFKVTKKMSYYWNFPKTNFISDPLEYERKRFGYDLELEEKRELTFKIEKESRFNGFLFWNNILASKNNTINTLRGSSWPAVFIPVTRKSIKLSPGDGIILKTYQDLRINPKYQFKALVKTGKTIVEFETIKIGR